MCIKIFKAKRIMHANIITMKNLSGVCVIHLSARSNQFIVYLFRTVYFIFGSLASFIVADYFINRLFQAELPFVFVKLFFILFY